VVGGILLGWLHFSPTPVQDEGTNGVTTEGASTDVLQGDEKVSVRPAFFSITVCLPTGVLIIISIVPSVLYFGMYLYLCVIRNTKKWMSSFIHFADLFEFNVS
jgi:hypothetical protein